MRYNVLLFNRLHPDEDISARHQLRETLTGYTAPPFALRMPRMAYNRTYNHLIRGEDIAVNHPMREALMGWTTKPFSIQFPRLAYNRQPFNRPVQTEENLPLQVAISEELQGWLKIGADYKVEYRLHGQVSGNMRLAAGQRLRTGLVEALGGHLQGVTGHQTGGDLREAFSGSLHMGGDIHLQQSGMAENLSGDLHVGADIYTVFMAAEELKGLLHMGSNIYITPALYETLNGYANVRNIATYLTRISDPIPAGAVLVIDAASYTVTLQDAKGNKDVIHWHSGDWLQIGRGTISLTLSGIGAKSYNWEVFYHSLYL